MKRNILFLAAAASALILTACSANEINPEAEAKKDEEYMECLSLIGENNLDENGFYSLPSDEQEPEYPVTIPDGKILVSLGKNNTMDLQYYRDAECSEIISGTVCWVNPGDEIYAKYPLFKTSGTDRKLFDRFEIYYYNDKGERNHDASLECENDADAQVLKVLRVPNNFDYNNLSIVPVSTFEDRELTLFDYYVDTDEKKVSLSQRWEISTGSDTLLFTENEKITINPFNNYIVRLVFDKDKYYFSSSSPKAWHYDNTVGYVEFHQQNAEKAINEFSVELSPYTPITIGLEASGISADLTLSNSATNNVEVTTDISKVRGIKGDHLTCRITKPSQGIDLYKLIKEHKLTIENLKLVSGDKNNNTWNFEIIDSNEQFLFDPSIFTFKNGRIDFYYKNNLIVSPVMLYEGDVLKYKAIPDRDFFFIGGQQDEYELVFSPVYSEYQIQNEFTFEQKKTVQLDYPKEGGKIIYFLNGKQLPDDQKEIFYLKGTDHLTVEFELNPNYKLSTEKAYSGMEITFGSGNQVKIDGKTVSDLFVKTTESSQTELEININSSVGTELRFSVNSYQPTEIINQITTGLWATKYVTDDKGKGHFEKGEEYIGYIDGSWWGNTKYSGHVFVANGLTINVNNGNFTQNKALRFTIDSADKDGNNYHYIRYVDHVPGSVDIPFDTTKIYKSIKITVEKVDVRIHNSVPFNITDTDVLIRFTDDSDKSVLKNGDIVEDNRNVELIVTAKPGYEIWVDGKVVSEYKITAKYQNLFEEQKRSLVKFQIKEKE